MLLCNVFVVSLCELAVMKMHTLLAPSMHKFDPKEITPDEVDV
jgi:hypothetical protein